MISLNLLEQLNILRWGTLKAAAEYLKKWYSKLKGSFPVEKNKHLLQWSVQRSCGGLFVFLFFLTRYPCKRNKAAGKRTIVSDKDFSPTWKWTPNSGHWFQGRWLLCGCNGRLVRLWSFLKRFAQFRIQIYSYVRKRFAQIAQGLLRTHLTLFFIVLFWCWKMCNLVSGLCMKTSANDVGRKWHFCRRR